MSEAAGDLPETVRLTESTWWTKHTRRPRRLRLSKAEYDRITDVNASVRASSRYNEDEMLRVWRDGETAFGGERLTFKWATNSVVGVVGLPSGRQLRITPRTSPNRLGWLLQYAKRIEPVLEDAETTVGDDGGFLDAVAALYVAELRAALRNGLDRQYEHRTDTRQSVRGRLAVAKQLKRAGPAATEFVCQYDELTADTVLNRALLQATTTFKNHVRTARVAASLERLERRLERHVTARPVTTPELERVTVNRLNERFQDAFTLARYVLWGRNVGGFGTDADSYSLLFSLSTVFEEVGRRALLEGGLRDAGYTIDTQQSRAVTETGDFKIVPDVLVSDDDDDIAVVGDMKWKSTANRKPKREDLYQLISYQTIESAPGVLVYPDQESSFEPAVLRVRGADPLFVLELPTSADVSDYTSYVRLLRAASRETVEDVLDVVE